MQRFIIPRISPTVSSKLTRTITSFAGMICTSCGLLSTRSTESCSGRTFSQAFCISLRNRLVMRETSRSSISVSGRRGRRGRRDAAAQQPVDHGEQNRRVDVENQLASSGAAVIRLKQVGFSRLKTNSLKSVGRRS